MTNAAYEVVNIGLTIFSTQKIKKIQCTKKFTLAKLLKQYPSPPFYMEYLNDYI